MQDLCCWCWKKFMFAFNLKSIFWGTMLWRAKVYNGTKAEMVVHEIFTHIQLKELVFLHGRCFTLLQNMLCFNAHPPNMQRYLNKSPENFEWSISSLSHMQIYKSSSRQCQQSCIHAILNFKLNLTWIMLESHTETDIMFVISRTIWICP